ncbi:MAG: MotA/TolQ/ExbB proton channel family protein [Chitinophagaceae bacterium]|nr:MAG: MotA/TolQ/ExbB proton channel [Bacteroidetes bacterium OLB11]MCC6448537.1 MotA/TolQ/ExbB proton channel family protein [Chitinophagaceae bacterium]HMN33010.1 MotA/TolQ/ExbB proton channel family protein [Chitinophagaceae bacterium]
MSDVKPKTNAVPNTANSGKKESNSMLLNFMIVLVCIAVGHAIFHFIFSSVNNFNDGAARHQPKNLMGTMYLGGWVVPILMSTFLVMLSFVVERALTIFKSRGKLSNAEFIKKVQFNLSNKNVDAAISECDKQAGSVGNVMKAGLKKYKEMMTSTGFDTDQKVEQIKKEVEETTSLELPMLEKNLVFLSTITSAATLLGLFGTVMGMIRAFAAMANAGAPDANALAAGISEALVNTALGIGTSFIAMLAYNFFTTIIDNITFGIDESGFTLEQSFKAIYK